MTKSELIDAITLVNRSATRDFLAEFSERELADYVRQLSGSRCASNEYDSSPTAAFDGMQVIAD